MFYLLLAVIVFGFGFLLYLYYRDQKQEKNSYRTNAFHICRIEALEERDFLSASPPGDFYNDDNDDYEPPYNPSDTYIEYNAYSNAAAQQNAPEMSAAADLNISLYTANPATVTAASDAYEINTNTAETAFLNTMQTFTFAAAFKVDSTAGWHYILCRDCPTNQGAEIFLRIRDGKLQFGYWDTRTNYMAETAVSANTWYSVAGEYDGTTWKLYVNGELKNTKTYTPPKGITNLDVNNKGYTPKWYVGRHGTETDKRIFGGEISNLAVYTGQLAAPEFDADSYVLFFTDTDPSGTPAKTQRASYNIACTMKPMII